MGNFKTLFHVENDALVSSQEDLILDVTEQIWNRMHELDVSKSELARKLDTSKANVTQLLNGGRNMTLRTLAHIAYVLDTEVCFHFGEHAETGFWEEIGTALLAHRVHTQDVGEIESANTEWVDVADMATPV